MPKKPTDRTQFLFERTTDRSKAMELAGIKTLDLTITQDIYNHYPSPYGPRTNKYNKGNVPSRINCCNPRCKRGGLDLKNFLMFYENVDDTFRCNGDEGSPAGRNKGTPCDNGFKVVMKIEREK